MKKGFKNIQQHKILKHSPKQFSLYLLSEKAYSDGTWQTFLGKNFIEKPFL